MRLRWRVFRWRGTTGWVRYTMWHDPERPQGLTWRWLSYEFEGKMRGRMLSGEAGSRAAAVEAAGLHPYRWEPHAWVAREGDREWLLDDIRGEWTCSVWEGERCVVSAVAESRREAVRLCRAAGMVTLDNP